MKIKHTLLGILGVLAAGHAMAVPWCHRGTIVTVATVNWSGATTVANSPACGFPTLDPDRCAVFHSTNNYCQTYAGGGGPSWPWSVPGAGTVSTHITGPYILTNTVNNYDLSMGVSFQCKKCYSIPPFHEHHELEMVSPFPGIIGLDEYMEKVEPRDDD